MCKRVLNKRTNLGNKYLEKIYIITVNKTKLNNTWFTKKKGISCGIFLYNIFIKIIFFISLKKSLLKLYKRIKFYLRLIYIVLLCTIVM